MLAPKEPSSLKQGLNETPIPCTPAEPPGLMLFVYYKAPAAHTQALHRAVQELFLRLGEQHPGLYMQWMRRTQAPLLPQQATAAGLEPTAKTAKQEPADLLTFMEIYTPCALAPGQTTPWAQVLAQAAQATQPHIQGGRHEEWFTGLTQNGPGVVAQAWPIGLCRLHLRAWP
jgi:hypothetical protein